MNFNDHYRLKGLHAFLSASNYHWINYSEDKLVERYNTHRAASWGSRLHNLASELIETGTKLPRNSKTLNMYVNDAIGYRMTTEQPLYFTENAFGTCDAIGFRKKKLRIHDLKTGVTKANMNQLRVYAALFCLEYNIKPSAIEIELRIYQNDDIVVEIPEVEDIIYIMDRLKTFDALIEELKQEEVR